MNGREGKEMVADLSRLFFFLACCMAYGILVPRPGTEPEAMAVEALSSKH